MQQEIHGPIDVRPGLRRRLLPLSTTSGDGTNVKYIGTEYVTAAP